MAESLNKESMNRRQSVFSLIGVDPGSLSTIQRPLAPDIVACAKLRAGQLVLSYSLQHAHHGERRSIANKAIITHGLEGPGLSYMSIRLHSTVGSVRNGDITVLAIVETVLAISITVFIAVYYETLMHIAVSACIAPLLLLRTEESTERGLRWFAKAVDTSYTSMDAYDDFLESPSSSRFVAVRIIYRMVLGVLYIPLVVVIVFGLVPVSFAIKIVATTYSFLRHPIYTISAIPHCWKRIALCTDMAYPPELLPGVEEEFEKFQIYSFRGFFIEMLSEFKTQNLFNKGMQFLQLVVFSLIPLAAIIISFSYRWSLKSTSLVYAPLAWLMNSTISVRKNLNDYLLFAAKSALGKFVFYFSFAIVLLSLFKIYLLFWAQSALTILDNTPGWNIMTIYLAPRQLENVGVVVDLWHVTAFINALLAIFMFFYADLVLLRMKENQQWSEKTAIAITGGNIFLRGFLSLYTITCVLYVTIKAIPPETWQQFKFQLVPW